MNPPPPPGERALRADARQNIEQILQVARTVFADLGYEVSIEEVARRSGLAVGTINRHFPNKSALVERITIEVMSESLAEVRRALAEETGAWDTFIRVMRHMVRVRSSQLYPNSRGGPTEPGPEPVGVRTALLAALHELVLLTQKSVRCAAM
ncbi:MAG: regulatory protein TetR [Mycobacterium sp.]|jgi:AcrR family transcriptional regulator|nr:regulatory protein TetR [Mycobacterium sp.]